MLVEGITGLVRSSFLIAAGVALFPTAWAEGKEHQAERLPSRDSTIFYASFETKTQPEIAVPGSIVKWRGETRIEKHAGVNAGGALLLGIDGYGEIDSSNVNISEGTVCFWFNPVGDPLGDSHTYLSWAWEKGGWPYMVFSQGWWEGGGGAGSTYFVFNNATTHVSGVTDPRAGYWRHYAISWKLLKDRRIECRLYENGRLLGNRQSKSGQRLAPDARIATPVYLGTDLGSGLPKDRSAQGYVNHFTIYRKALSANEISGLFLIHAPPALAKEAANPYLWMEDAIHKKPREKRDKDGMLLESRVIFSEALVLHYQDRDKMLHHLDRIKNSGWNVYAPVVWHGAGMECYSRNVRMCKRYENFQKAHPDYDSYRTLIEEAHKRGMQIHSAFCVMKNRGKGMWPEYEVENTRWYNGYDPRFRDFIVKVMLDHVEEYDIDGFSYDFIRVQSGLRSKEAVEEYTRLYGRDLDADMHDREKMAEFTSYCVNDIVRRTTQGARRIRPNIVISTCAKVQLKSEGLSANGRNPRLWLDKGWVDVVYDMDYGKRLSVERMDRARAESEKPYAYVIGLGNYDFAGGTLQPRDPKLFAKLVDYCRKKYNDGNGLFVYFYRALSDEQIRELRKGPFKELAKPDWRR